MFHRHNWDLIDKAVVPPAVGAKLKWGKSEMTESMAIHRQESIRRMAQGYVVLTFKCQCGKIRIEER
jgi:hypothetical protein